MSSVPPVAVNAPPPAAPNKETNLPAAQLRQQQNQQQPMVDPSKQPDKPSTDGNNNKNSPSTPGRSDPPEGERKKLESLVDEVNRTLNGMTTLNISMDKDLGQYVVKVVDRTSNKVIRQIPSENMVDLAKRMHELRGLLLDAQA